MTRLLSAWLTIPLLTCLTTTAAFCDTYNVGIVSFDVTNAPLGEFDITNQTGPNASVFPDMTFAVSTPVSFNSLCVTVWIASGPTQSYESYFTLAPDGLSFDGQDIFDTGTVKEAVLTGTFSATTLKLNNGKTVTISPNFTVYLLPSSGSTLSDGDFGIITASTP